MMQLALSSESLMPSPSLQSCLQRHATSTSSNSSEILARGARAVRRRPSRPRRLAAALEALEAAQARAHAAADGLSFLVRDDSFLAVAASPHPQGACGRAPMGINRVRLTSPSPPPRRRTESSAFMGSTGRYRLKPVSWRPKKNRSEVSGEGLCCSQGGVGRRAGDDGSAVGAGDGAGEAGDRPAGPFHAKHQHDATPPQPRQFPTRPCSEIDDLKRVLNCRRIERKTRVFAYRLLGAGSGFRRGRESGGRGRLLGHLLLLDGHDGCCERFLAFRGREEERG